MFANYPKSNHQPSSSSNCNNTKNSFQSLFSGFILSPATFALSLIFVLSWSCGWGQYSGTGTFNKITSLTDLTDGYYVIVNSGDAFAMNNTHNGTYLANTSISPSSNTLTNPATSIVWKIETNGTGRTIYNESTAKYVSYTGTSNNVQVVDAVSANNQRWTFSYASSVFSVANLAVTTRILQYNSSSPRFACYTSAQQKFLLYKLAPSATAPTLTSPTVSSITTTSATLGATVSSNGGAALSARGTVWGTTASPTGNSLAEGGTSVAAFTHSRTGLTANTAYTYRGYATNSAGTGYSADGTFTTFPLAPIVGTANSVTASGFTANWSHPTMGAASYTYTVEVDDDNAFGSINSTVSSIASSNTSQAIIGLAASTTYYYRVKAVNAQGSSVWSSTSAGVTTSSAATPTLNPVTLASALSSTYGTASAGVSFTASGSNLTSNITATAQSGYEVSTSSSSGYGASVSVAAGTTVYVRFASTISSGNKDNAIAVVLSGGGASSSANVTTSSSGNTVSQKALTVTGLTAQNKTYDGLTTATVTGTATLSGVVGGDAVSLTGSPSFTFSSANVGTGISVSTSGYSLIGGDAANYTLTQPTLSANITVRSLTITANDVNKFAGVALTGGAGSSAFTSSGLQNGETIGSVTIAYGSAGATTGDGNTVGVYASQVTPSAATGGTFTASNYSISYVVGSITVTAAPVVIAIQDFETSPATPTWSYSGTGNTFSVASKFNDAKSYGLTALYSLTMDNLDISGYSDVVLSVAFAASGPDSGEDLFMDISYDNGSNWTGAGSVKLVDGFSNTSININSTNALNPTTVSSNPWPTAIGSSETQIRARFRLGASLESGEYYYLDDIKLTGIPIPTEPLLSTPTVSSISTTSVTLGATITSDGGATITSRGTVYGTSASPTANSGAEGGTSVATFSHSRTSLTANTLYYYRGYAVNSVGTGYSADGTFTTLHNAPTVGSGSNAATTTIDASWTAPTGGSAIFTYEIEVDDNNDFSSPTFTQSGISSASTTITATGLVSNTTYYFRVRANNAGGNSAWSSSSSGYTTLVALNPTLSTTSLTAFGNVCLNATSGANSFTINGSALTSADVSVSSLSGFTFSTTVGGTYTSSLTLPQIGGTYAQAIYVKFTPTAVQSYDGNIVVSGGGASSNENVAASGSGISGTLNVTTTVASAISTSGASTGGTSVSTSCGTITSKGVAYGTTANPTTPVTSDGSGTADYSSLLTGLTPNTEYNYRAYATNSNGVTSYGSNLTFTTVHNAPTVGIGTLATTTGFTANWTAPTSGGSAIFTYELAISTSPTFASTLSTQSGISSASTSYQFTGLSNGTTYYFRVRANNSGGSSDWSAISTSISTQTVFENFETGSKASYTTGDVNCTSGSWNFNNALIGTLANDRKYGTQSVRIQSTGIVSMNFDVSNGISSLTVYHALYGTDPNATWKIEVSNNAGSSWDAYVSSIVTTSTTTLTAQTFNVDLCGSLRFRIVKLTGTRLNIDDIVLVEKAPTPSAPTASAQSFCSSISPTVADLTVTSGSSIKWYDASTNGNLLASGTVLTSGTFYASQTVSGCESTIRTSVAITLNSNGAWIGGSSGNWDDANNWCGGIPNSNSVSVSIPSGVTVNLDTSPSISELTIATTSVIDAGNNTITIANGGAFTNNGTFNAQTGTVAFSGTGTLAGNATAFNNLTTNGNLTASASPTINGTLTLSSGTLTVGANTLTVNGSISTTSGNIDASNASATVVFGGSTAQTIPASTFTNNINNLTLNNSAGLTTNQVLTVANTLNLVSGILTLGANNLTLTGSLDVSNSGSSTAFINTNSSGAFIRSISSTGIDYKFPVGLSDYAPISVNFTGGTIASSTLASRAVSGLHPEATDGAYIRSNLYWEMNQSGMTNPQYNVSFTYPGVTNGVGSSETESNLLPAKWSASTGWLSSGSCAICYNGSTMGTSSINTTTKTITWNGVSGFSDFGGFGEGNGSPLPVELLSFNGICDENQIQLTWSTASENNSDYFEILKSQDGENWRAVNKQAAAGFSTTIQMYSFTETEKTNNAYFRLNQVDFNGDNKMYDPIFIDCEGNSIQLITYPNPSKDGFNVVISDKKLVGEASLIIRDAMGKMVLLKVISIIEGTNIFPIETNEIDNGVYFITIESEYGQSKVIRQTVN